MKRLAPIFVLWWLVCGICEAAGIAVHLTVAARVSSYFPLDVQEETAALLAGAFFPDALYGCMDRSDYAEAAHWPPLFKRAVQHYLDESPTDAKLKAFLYGVFTHQIADVSWHSLHGKQGLLQYLSGTEFAGDDSKAHPFLDTAGDFITLSRQFSNQDADAADEVASFYRTKWDYPAAELAKIYQEFGFPPISKHEIDVCMLRGYTALQAEVTGSRTGVASRRLGYYVDHSPLLDDVLEPYFYGGVDQIVNSIEECLPNINAWFAGEISDDPWKLCSIFSERPSAQSQGAHGDGAHGDGAQGDGAHSDQYVLMSSSGKKSSRSPAAAPLVSSTTLNITGNDVDGGGAIFVSSHTANSLFGHTLRIGRFLGKSLCLAIGAPMEEHSGALYVAPISELLHGGTELVNAQNYIPSNGTELELPYRFGEGMATWKMPSGLDLLAVAQPGNSTIHVYSDGILLAILSQKNAVTNAGAEGIKQLGISMRAFDFDKDGYEDLLVTSPYCDRTDGHKQLGYVAILNGQRLQRKLIPGEVVTIEMDELLIKQYRPPPQFVLPGQYDNFGSVLATTANFVIIGYPSIASALIYDKLTGYFLGRVSSQPTIPKGRVGSAESGLFSWNFILTGKFHSKEWVLISASAQTQDTCTMCGTVYLFVVYGFGLRRVAKIVPSRGTEYSYSRFGTSAVVSSVDAGRVLVSGPGYNGGQGAIWEIPIGDLLTSRLHLHNDGEDAEQQSMDYDDDSDIFLTDNIVLTGPENVGYTDFGKSLVRFTHYGNDYLAVGMPRYGSDSLTLATSLDSGSVGMYPLGGN